MKRDWSLIRALLAHFESETIEQFCNDTGTDWTEGQYLSGYIEALDRASRIRSVILEHIRQLVERGLVDGVEVDSAIGGDVVVFCNPRLTSDGHDLLEAMRSDTLWAKVKEVAESSSIGLTIATVKAIIPVAVKSLIGG